MPIYRIAGIILTPVTAAAGVGLLGGLFLCAFVVFGFLDLIGVKFSKTSFQPDTARLSSMQFFEGGEDGVAENQRRYGTVFSRAKTRYIYSAIQVQYQMPATAWNEEADIRVVWYKPDGSVFVEQNTKQAGLQNGNILYVNPRVGWDEFGKWDRGSYKITVFVSGRDVGSGTFTVK